MAIELAPIPLPATASRTDFDPDFGREVKGVKPGELTPEQFKEIETALYTVGLGSSPGALDLCTSQHVILLFRDAALTPEQQYALTKVGEFIDIAFNRSSQVQIGF